MSNEDDDKKLELKSLKKTLGIDETNTRTIKRPKLFTTMQDTVPPLEDYNFMADLLSLPETKDGHKAAFVVVDLATREFDVEPVKSKKPEEILRAFKAMLKRPHLSLPFASFATDGGTEFKGVFEKFLKDNNIFRKVAAPYRHSQQSTVESLNRLLGRLFNGYMNAVEERTKKQYNEWTDVIDIIRTDLNKYRKVDKLPDIFDIEPPSFIDVEPAYKVGDVVYYQLDYPQNALGNKQPTSTFREGDYRWSRVPKKITAVLYISGKIPFRYTLEGRENVSYTGAQLKLAGPQEDATKFEVKKIIGRQMLDNGGVNYKVWWIGKKKGNADWVDEKELIKDGIKPLLDAYDAANPRPKRLPVAAVQKEKATLPVVAKVIKEKLPVKPTPMAPLPTRVSARKGKENRSSDFVY